MFYLIDKNYKIEIINTTFDNLLRLKVFKWISALNSIIIKFNFIGRGQYIWVKVIGVC